MSDPEVVVRLLAAVAEAEKPELDALIETGTTWGLDVNDPDDSDLVVTECLRCSWSLKGREDEIDPRVIEHVRVCQQTRGLRLCRSHRDIVAEWQRARADYDDASLKQGRSLAIWPAEIAELEQRVVVTLARLQALEIVLRFVARGYGIEDGETT